MSDSISLKYWIKSSDNYFAVILFRAAKYLRYFNGPSIPWLYKFIYHLRSFFRTFFSEFLRMFYYTPLFKSQLKSSPKKLLIYDGLPHIMGTLDIKIGEDVRISAATSFAGRGVSKTPPLLQIGNNVDIGWQTGISVGSKIIIGNNVRISGRSTLSGYPGHPVNAKKRALGLPEDDEQVGDIIIEDDVWLATGVNVMANVRIGKGTIVACGSVVTKDLPANVLAGGIPAKIIRHLTENDND